MPALRDRDFSDDEPVVVSICTIAFNHADYIRPCLDGFLDQESDFRIEVVIHDDASTDETAAIIQEYAEAHPTIFRTFLQTENRFSKGVNPYYAYVFPAARGKYIAICDGDDFWSDPQKLATQVDYLERNPEVALTFGRVRKVSGTETVEEYSNGAERDLSADALKSVRGLNTLTTCFRNIFEGSAPPIFLKSSPIGDLTVWAMLGYHGSGHFMPDLPRANYRVHDGGILSLQSNSRQLLMTALCHLSIASYHCEQGDMRAARVSARICLKTLLRLGLLAPKDLAQAFFKSLQNRG